MAIAKSNTNDLASLFKEGYFNIPPYQRRYSWEEKQQLDLFNDLLEAFETKSIHFLGTLSLQLTSTKGFDAYYNIIDGQQRFTTLLLLYSCLAHLTADKRYLSFLKRNDKYFLEPINQEEKEYLLKLLDGQQPKPITYSQSMMLQAVKEYTKRSSKFIGKEKINDFLDHMLNKTQFLIYLVDDYTASIRMFESINDRGMQLGYFDKIKSFFLYYSDKYLDRSIDNDIQVAFDKIYRFFDNEDLKLGINNDETLLLYHYLSNPVFFESWSYTKSTENIFIDLKTFILKAAQKNVSVGKKYIQDYLQDISEFITSCLSIEQKLTKNIEYKEFYFLLEPNQRMYPLSIRFNQIGILDDVLPMLEKIEFYLKYKRDPKKDIFRLLEEVISFDGSKDDLYNNINNKFCEIYEWQESAIDIANNAAWASKYALYLYNKITYEQNISPTIYKKLEIEHIFPQNPSFPIRKYGFNEDTYDQLLWTIGNYTLLEKELNGSEGATNKIPEDKIKEDYINSDVKMTQEINVKSMKDVIERNNLFEKFLNGYFYFEPK
jgi:uncharacterized protein with ParB-like and HNH nuclease domain